MSKFNDEKRVFMKPKLHCRSCGTAINKVRDEYFHEEYHGIHIAEPLLPSTELQDACPCEQCTLQAIMLYGAGIVTLPQAAALCKWRQDLFVNEYKRVMHEAKERLERYEKCINTEQLTA